jgi:myo-inositol-1(or 4)-monophosphatase
MSRMDSSEIEAQLAAAVAILEEAGPIALRHFRTSTTVENKAGEHAFDPVTAADREIEAFVRRRLRRDFPDHGILGEEEGFQPGTNDACWVLDPIDGTRAFMSGMPAWGMLLGLTLAKRPVAGAMHQPYLGETFSGICDAAAWLRRGSEQRRLATRATTRIAEAVLYATDPSLFATAPERAAFERVSQACLLRRFGGDCYAYCLLALGQVDLVIENQLQPYDIVPLIPILEGAGGVVTGRDGGTAQDGGFVVAAGNRELHARALEFLNSD